MKFISDTMFLLSNGLLIPVIIGLLFLFLLSLLMIGGLIQSYQRHKQQRRRYFDLSNELSPSALVDRLGEILQDGSRQTALEELLRRILRSGAAQREMIIGEYELYLDKKLYLARTLSKFGPILGLMGTLIPMGPALVGLSAGDMATMAYNMQVAFATTVLGLFVSAIGHIALQQLQGYHHQELLFLDYLTQILEHNEQEASQTAAQR